MRHRVLLRGRDGARQPHAAQDRRARHLHEPRVVHQSNARLPARPADGLAQRPVSVPPRPPPSVHSAALRRHRSRASRRALRQDDRRHAR